MDNQIKKVFTVIMFLILITPIVAYGKPTARINESGEISRHFNERAKKYEVQNQEELLAVSRDMKLNFVSIGEIEIKGDLNLKQDEIAELFAHDDTIVSGVDCLGGKLDLTGDRITVNLSYSVPLEKRIKLEQWAEEWVQKNITPTMTDIEKIERIYREVTSYGYYATDTKDLSVVYAQRFDPISLLEQGKGVCSAHAGLLRILAQKCGLEAKDVIHPIGDDNHIWNAVRIDGKWYHFDSSWDAKATQWRWYKMTPEAMYFAKGIDERS